MRSVLPEAIATITALTRGPRAHLTKAPPTRSSITILSGVVTEKMILQHILKPSEEALAKPLRGMALPGRQTVLLEALSQIIERLSILSTRKELLKSAGRLFCVWLMIGLVAPSAASAQGRAFESSESWLDRVKFGDAESERDHQLETDHSEVIESAQDPPKFLHIASVTATAGSAPESTLIPAGEWEVLRKGEWIDYELSGRTTVDHLRVAWGRTQTFFF